MYAITSAETASFCITFTDLEWRPGGSASRSRRYLSMYARYLEPRVLLSTFKPETFLYRRKADLVDRILAIAENVPEEEWNKVPPDLSTRYRNYKLNVVE